MSGIARHQWPPGGIEVSGSDAKDGRCSLRCEHSGGDLLGRSTAGDTSRTSKHRLWSAPPLNPAKTNPRWFAARAPRDPRSCPGARPALAAVMGRQGGTNRGRRAEPEDEPKPRTVDADGRAASTCGRRPSYAIASKT